jgi:molecular chaperone DnaK (HSP70)
LAQAAKDSMNTIVSVKRLMGRGIEDVSTLGDQLPYRFSASEGGMPRFETVSGNVTPVEVSAEIIRTLVDRASATLGGDLGGVVITIPAYFDDAQRQATKDAAQLFDRAIATWIVEQSGYAKPLAREQLRGLLMESRSIKEDLTDLERVDIDFDRDGVQFKGVLDRATFDELVAPLVDADGLLSVSARETSTGTQASVEVKPSYGLTDNEITSMLQASFEHAAEDADQRSLR